PPVLRRAAPRLRGRRDAAARDRRPLRERVQAGRRAGAPELGGRVGRPHLPRPAPCPARRRPGGAHRLRAARVGGARSRLAPGTPGHAGPRRGDGPLRRLMAPRAFEQGSVATTYAVEGSGPPLLLVHGVGARLDNWDGVVAALGGR